jgi:hypothetical protein
MKLSNIVISTAAAVSMAGALGLAYAQSTYSDPQNPDPMTRDSATGTTSPSATGTSPGATGTTSQDYTTTETTRSDSMYRERVARADRN